jgi:hypothetical protein
MVQQKDCRAIDKINKWIHIWIFQYRETYLIKLPEDGLNYGPKHIAVIKLNKYKQLDWFVLFWKMYYVDGQSITNIELTPCYYPVYTSRATAGASPTH